MTERFDRLSLKGPKLVIYQVDRSDKITIYFFLCFNVLKCVSLCILYKIVMQFGNNYTAKIYI